MPVLKTKHVKIRGICCALPKGRKTIYDIGEGYFDRETIEKTTSAIGVKYIYTAAEGMTASDLCFEAAERLMEKLGWERDTVDGVLFVSQTPDYKLPATACVLQHRLGLSDNCVAMDINLGCSGFVYGVFTAAQFLENATCKRVLVMVGDTVRGHISPMDKGITFIISDAGTATALEYAEDTDPMSIAVYTDGSGYRDLIIEGGGSRLPVSEETKQYYTDSDGSKRRKEDLYMNGMGIFTFAVKRVPVLLRDIMAEHGWTEENVDLFLLHQANAYMVKYISKRAKIPETKIPINIDKYGNTNGSTIPLLICDLYHEDPAQSRRAVLAGFGVGLSWGGITLTLGDLLCADIITVQ
jgi:3-oxoacyl-[acyl-carrier-protein] synthase-3